MCHIQICPVAVLNFAECIEIYDFISVKNANTPLI